MYKRADYCLQRSEAGDKTNFITSPLHWSDVLTRCWGKAESAWPASHHTGLKVALCSSQIRLASPATQMLKMHSFF